MPEIIKGCAAGRMWVLSMTTMLQKSEFLQLPNGGSGVFFGCDQDWFKSFWQRKAGCGPCAGANLLLYLGKTGKVSLPLIVKNQADFLSLMEVCWTYLTPTIMGLNTPHLMQKGLDAYFQSRESNLLSRALEIPAENNKRPALSQVESFILEGLMAESPVAFLNLSNGKIAELESWHWVTVVGLSGTGESAELLIYDNGNQIRVNLNLWLNTTTRGGGFVYVYAPAANSF